jgi:hypothetical protein
MLAGISNSLKRGTAQIASTSGRTHDLHQKSTIARNVAPKFTSGPLPCNRKSRGPKVYAANTSEGEFKACLYSSLPINSSLLPINSSLLPINSSLPINFHNACFSGSLSTCSRDNASMHALYLYSAKPRCTASSMNYKLYIDMKVI